MKKNLVIFFIFIITALTPLNSFALLDDKMGKGVKLYNDGKFEDALSNFNDAQVEDPDDKKIEYNRSNTQYKLGKYDDTVNGYQKVISGTKDKGLREKAFYNLGNSEYKKGNLKGAEQSYREALKIDPNDKEAKQNLEFVLKKLQEQKKNQDRQPTDNKEKDNTGKEDKDKENNSQSKEQEDNKKSEESKNKKNENENKNSGNKSEGEKNKNEDNNQKSASGNKTDEQGKNGASVEPDNEKGQMNALPIS